MKILVTGGLGFIGSNFCRHMLTKTLDDEVVNIDKVGPGANPASLKDLKNETRYEFIRGNICNSELLNETIGTVDAVVNIAAETHVDRSIANPSLFVQSNTLGLFTVLEAVRKHNDEARLVQVSTDEIYGDIAEGSFKENDPLKPSNPYSASKAAGDMFAVAYSRTYDLNITVTRCTNNYGPYQFPEKLIPKSVIRALKNLEIPVYGSGNNVRDWIHVQDHCKAIELALKEGKRGEIYNVSTGNELPNIKIVKRILELLDKPEDLIHFVEDRPGHDQRYSLDSTKIRSELKWKPEFSIEEGLKITVDWYVANEWWWKPLATDDVLQATPWKPRYAS